jgi:hypothetical protein
MGSHIKCESAHRVKKTYPNLKIKKIKSTSCDDDVYLKVL